MLAAADNKVLEKLLGSIADGARARIAAAARAARAIAGGAPTDPRRDHRPESELAEQLMFRHLEVTGEMMSASGNGRGL